MATRTALRTLVAVCLFGCATSDRPITLAERFELVALRDDAGTPVDQLWKWSWPIDVSYVGDPAHRDDVIRHAELLGQLADLPVRYVEYEENLLVRIVNREDLKDQANAAALNSFGRDYGPELRQGFTCMFNIYGTPERYWASVGIADDLPDWRVRRCIVQEMTQILGLTGDLDGRTDTNFTSNGQIIELTAYDRQLIAILYDDRLYTGMPREEVLAVLPAIVAEMEAEQAADSR